MWGLLPVFLALAWGNVEAVLRWAGKGAGHPGMPEGEEKVGEGEPRDGQGLSEGDSETWVESGSSESPSEEGAASFEGSEHEHSGGAAQVGEVDLLEHVWEVIQKAYDRKMRGRRTPETQWQESGRAERESMVHAMRSFVETGKFSYRVANESDVRGMGCHTLPGLESERSLPEVGWVKASEGSSHLSRVVEEAESGQTYGSIHSVSRGDPHPMQPSQGNLEGHGWWRDDSLKGERVHEKGTQETWARGTQWRASPSSWALPGMAREVDPLPVACLSDRGLGNKAGGASPSAQDGGLPTCCGRIREWVATGGRGFC